VSLSAISDDSALQTRPARSTAGPGAPSLVRHTAARARCCGP